MPCRAPAGRTGSPPRERPATCARGRRARSGLVEQRLRPWGVGGPQGAVRDGPATQRELAVRDSFGVAEASGRRRQVAQVHAEASYAQSINNILNANLQGAG